MIIRRGLGALVLLAALLTGCAGASARSAESVGLAGTWRGRMSGPMGAGPLVLTVASDGTYQGLLYLEPQYREIRGAISVLGFGNIRYEGNDGNGKVTLRDEGGRRVLRLVPDGGGGGAELVPSP